jgi:peptidoglycan/LPS O-acetylase OafA/YrhL
METKRINFIDGFRGLAILLVILYHSYTRWPSIVPYGNKFADFPLFRYGNLGVELFFLISGFVILMTLEKCQNFHYFIYKRWIRLFPAMLIVTIIIYATATFLLERPSGNPDFKSIFPGLLFIEPYWFNSIIGYKIIELEGTFWSLYAEVKFYFIFGFLYFAFGKNKAILGLVVLYLLCLISFRFHLEAIYAVCYQLSFIYFGWFAIGALAYIYYSTKEIKYLLISLGLAGLAGMVEIFKHKQQDVYLAVYVILILLLFFLPICFENFRSITNNKFLRFFGFISYPLYLIHENAMISLIIKLHKIFPMIPSLLLPILPIAFLCLIAYFIEKKMEPLLRKFIEKKINSVKTTRSHFRNLWLNK